MGKLSKLGPAMRPFEILSIDTVGGFAGGRSPKRYMHIVADHFSRKAFIGTTKHQTTQEFIKLIDRVTKGKEVKILLMDQYSALNSRGLKDYLSARGIQVCFTSPDTASSNGLNERLNQTLVNRIRCKINETPSKVWSKIAEECVNEYNRTRHTVTGFAPDYLMHGETDEIVPEALQQEKNLEEDRAKALLNSIIHFEANKKRVDKNRRNCDVREGDYVYVENGNKLNRSKLDEIRSGPYRVVKQVSKTMFEIERGKRKKESNIYHCSKLIPLQP